METIYTIGYSAADAEGGGPARGDVFESHRSLERAKERMLEIVRYQYARTIKEKGEGFITDNLSPDGMEFVADGGAYCQRYFIGENRLDG